MARLITLFNTATPLAALRRRWLLLLVVSLALLLLCYGWLHGQWPYARRWLLLATPILGYQWLLLWRNLAHNHAPDGGRLRPTLGVANLITIGRGFLLAVVGGFLFSPWPTGLLGWLPAVLYAIVGLSDIADGAVARRTGTSSVLGATLDMAYDSLGLLLVVGLGIWYGQLPWWYGLVGLARYGWLFGLWWRKRRGLVIRPLHHSVHRPIWAGIQMGFLSGILWPIAPAAGTRLAAVVVSLPFLLGFWRDWLVVAGYIDPEGSYHRRVRQGLYYLLSRVLPPVWRAVLLVTGLLLPMAWAGETAVFFRLCALVVSLGIVPRLLTIPLFLAVALDINQVGLQTGNSLFLVAALLILLFGAGPYALWPFDRHLFWRKAHVRSAQ
jgi:CDP-diacylglycerol---glycerol-3-phosphate 3-phosphatidyltransferase